MNIESLAPLGLRPEAEIIAPLDTENGAKIGSGTASGPAFAPVVGVVAMMAVALPLVFALRASPDGANFSTGGAILPSPTAIAWHTHFETAQRLAAASQKMMMIAFFADNCPDCQWMECHVYVRAPIIAAAQRIVALKINAEHFPQLARRYAVQKFPTLIWADAAGQEKHRFDGTMSGYELYQAMEQFH